ncbi:MAG TPA: hypothetical protein DIW64_18825 [Cellvibrio sp.]|nr:hypothetical protein [Cellvibrio sp.]
MSEKKYGLAVTYDPPLIEKIITKGHVNAARIRHFFSASKQNTAALLLLVSVSIVIATSYYVGHIHYGRAYDSENITSFMLGLEGITGGINQQNRKEVVPAEYLADGVKALTESLGKDTLPDGFKVYVTDMNTLLEKRLFSTDNRLYDAGWIVPVVKNEDLKGYLLFGVTSEIIGKNEQNEELRSLAPFIFVLRKDGDAFDTYVVPYFYDKNGKPVATGDGQNWYVPEAMQARVNLRLIPDFLANTVADSETLKSLTNSGVIKIKSTATAAQ